ncbi:MAG: thioesterase family protein [Firmicutes bacterium]|nr:thioesterase family protein [Bacillota bacterium]MBR6025486.1 thioesterase family protein [Bacillota bacterium]
MKDIPIGTTGIAEIDVTYDMTAASFDSNLPEVQATPFLIKLIETASRYAVNPYLEEGEGSVGAMVNIQHLAGSPIGFHVTAKATVTNVRGRIIDFDVEAWDDIETVGRGTHSRALINKAKHAAKLAEKKAKLENK